MNLFISSILNDTKDLFLIQENLDNFINYIFNIEKKIS